MSRRKEQAETFWAPVADAMTLVAGVFFMIFLAVLGAYQSGKDRELEKLTTQKKKADECVHERDELRAAQARVNRILASASREGVKVDGNTAVVGESLLFARDEYELLARGRTELKSIARIVANALREEEMGVVVEGHTDTVRFRNDRYGNWKLSSLRAVSVVEGLLESDAGIPADRVLAVGRGDSTPLPGIDGENGQNRRVVLRIEPIAQLRQRSPEGQTP